MATDMLEILLTQHKDLRDQSGLMKDLATSPKPDFNAILNGLTFFNLLLHGHLELENRSFYPQILNKLEQKGMDTSGVKVFISKMKDLEVKIIDFITKYDSAEKIENGFKSNEYQANLNDIVSALLLRIDSEEDGVYMYWKL